jgi:hypothetical protein
MDSITLKSELGKVVRMYGFNDENEHFHQTIKYFPEQLGEVKASGIKKLFLDKDESFWKELVEKEGIPYVDYFKDYINNTWIRFAKESGLSAIESLSENLYILIVETKE